MHILDFIDNRELKDNREKDIPFLSRFDQIVFDFVSFLFKEGWDQLKIERNNNIFWNFIKDEFTANVSTPSKGKKPNKFLPTKPVKFSKLSLPQLPPRPSKEFLKKSKFHGKNISDKKIKQVNINKLSYTQILSKNISNILKIKKNFLELSTKKIKELNKSIFNKITNWSPRSI